MVISSFRFLIGDPDESTAEMVTAFFFITAPLGGFGMAVLIVVVTVAELDPVPRELAGILSWKLAPISELVMYPPVVGVTVSGRSGFNVNPLMALTVIVWPDGLLPATVTGRGPPS